MGSSKFTKFLTFLVVVSALLYLRPDVRRTALVPVFHAAYRGLDWVQESYIAADPEIAWSLRGNFGPVPQQLPFTTDLKVSYGAIPQDIDGFCVKSGPNAAMPVTGLYHWFDGDGMLHGVRLANGHANYSNMQIETVRLQNERRLGWAATPKLGGLRGYSGLLRMLVWNVMLALDLADKPHSKGTANTASVYHHDALMALVEVEAPFEIHVQQDGQLRAGAERKLRQMQSQSQNVDSKSYYNTFNGAWEHPFTAHPKVDPVTGELIFFGYQVDKKPYCIYGLADKEGNLKVEFPVDIPDPIMMHDFAITEHYSIIMDLPLIFNPKLMIKGDMVFAYNSSRTARFGIFPRHPTSADEIVWFEVPSCYVFHPLNAWEEDGNIVMFASRFPDFTLTFNSQTKSDYLPYLYKWVFNLKTGLAEGLQSEVTEIVEFGRVNPTYLGRKTDYGYLGVIRPIGGLLINGVAKVDLRGNGKLLHKYIYDENIFGGEAVFVPKTRPVANCKDDQAKPPAEDDGYLVGFAHNEATEKSAFYIWEASDLSLVTIIDLPYRVPYGFHSTWVTGEDILKANS